MNRTPTWRIAAVIALALGALAYGVSVLFQLRFERGDVYPEYSTLRTDPRGGKALAEAFASVGVRVERNFRDLARARLPLGTLWIGGMNWDRFAAVSEGDWASVLAHVRKGGRLVMTFAPAAPPNPDELDHLPAVRRLREEMKREAEEAMAERPVEPLLVDRWALASTWLEATKSGEQTATRSIASADFPENIRWHTAVAFELNDAAWRTIYAVEGKPVVVEREFEGGSIVVLSDAFLLSNEALAQARHGALLAWLQGRGPVAVFDESHLDVVENPGVATLARHYGLTHAAWVLVLVVALFIWKNSTSVIPAAETETIAIGAGEFTGRESAAGFVNLLRRTLSPRDLFATCVQEFRRSTAWRGLREPVRAEFDALTTTRAAPEDPLGQIRAAHGVFARKLRSSSHS